MLALFTIVQYNDPDALLWILIYGLPTVWAGFAAYCPGALAHNQLFLSAFGLNVLAVGAGAIYMWPSEVSTWWDKEEIREGLGLIITTIALASRRVHTMAQTEPPAGGLCHLMLVH